MFKIFKYFKWYDWIGTLFIFGLTIAQVLCELELPEYMAKIVEYIVNGSMGLNSLEVSEAWRLGLQMLGFVAIAAAISIITGYLASKIAAGLAKRLRKCVFEKVGTFSMAEINKFSTASLITRSTNDVTQVQQVITMALKLFMFAPVMAIAALIKIINLNVTLTWTTFAFIAIMFIFLGCLMLLIFKKFGLLQKQTDDLNSVARENLTGLKVVRANNAEQLQEEKFNKANNSLTNTNLSVNKVTGFMMPGLTLIMSCLQLAIYWIGALIIKDSSAALTYSGVTEFAQYAIQVLMSFMFVSTLFIIIPRGSVSAKRICEVLDTNPSIVNGTLIPDTDVVGVVEFKNVFFKYPGAEEYVLEDVSFTAQRGQTVAFIGSTGSGKSTLINLVTRFYDATEGEILLDGVNVKDYKFKALNDKIGYIPQKSILFSGTIAENLRYGKPEATDEEIAKALKVAQADDFVDSLKGKVDFYVAQGGKNLSGGQQQRLSIARALIKNPEVLIFDDSFSALDYKTDRALRQSLAQDYSGTTKLIVAQRIGTILDADQIIVLDEGKVVGKGTHKELMKSCKVYQEIAYSQLSKEELENE